MTRGRQGRREGRTKALRRARLGLCASAVVVPFLLNASVSPGETGYVNTTNEWVELSGSTTNGRLWVMGGVTATDGTLTNDVWFSTNGVDWTCATNVATEWSRRNLLAAVPYDGKIWVLGGDGGGHVTNDVWLLDYNARTLGDFYLFRKE